MAYRAVGTSSNGSNAGVDLGGQSITWTVAAWVRPHRWAVATTGHGMWLVGKANAIEGAASQYEMVSINSSGYFVGHGFPSASLDATSVRRVPLGRWSHVAARYVGWVGLYVYIDGILEASNSASNPFQSNYTAGPFLRVGESPATSATAHNAVDDYVGDIEDVAFWASDLGALPIKALAGGASPENFNPTKHFPLKEWHPFEKDATNQSDWAGVFSRKSAKIIPFAPAAAPAGGGNLLTRSLMGVGA